MSSEHFVARGQNYAREQEKIDQTAKYANIRLTYTDKLIDQ